MEQPIRYSLPLLSSVPSYASREHSALALIPSKQEITPSPEPAAFFLLGSGLIGLSLYRKSRRGQNKQ